MKEKGLFENGLPVHDTVARIISRIDPSQLQRSFISWMGSVSNLLDGEVIAIDGKTLRSSYNRNDRKSTIHMVSAFATANGVIMGQIKTAEKSNEITAIPELLTLLDIKGCLVTIDAMGCQKGIAQAVVDKNADYLLALKGNQKKLHSAVYNAFKETISLLNQENAVIEKGHGRVEITEYHVMNAQAIAGEFPDWPKLTTIGVAMSEDACQISRDNGAENLACTRHIALNMLRAEKTKKASIPRKQRLAAMEISYLDKILEAGFKALSEN